MASTTHWMLHWILLMSCTSRFSQGQHVYYVTPNYARVCPDPRIPCHTLEEYVKMDGFLNRSDQTLLFLSGTHVLDTNVVIQGSTNLAMVGDDSQIQSSLTSNAPSSNIQCEGRFGFAFKVVQSLLIANLHCIR